MLVPLNIIMDVNNVMTLQIDVTKIIILGFYIVINIFTLPLACNLGVTHKAGMPTPKYKWQLITLQVFVK